MVGRDTQRCPWVAATLCCAATGVAALGISLFATFPSHVAYMVAGGGAVCLTGSLLPAIRADGWRRRATSTLPADPLPAGRNPDKLREPFLFRGSQGAEDPRGTPVATAPPFGAEIV